MPPPLRYISAAMARIVTYTHRPKRTRRKKAQQAAIAGPVIVTATNPRSRRKTAWEDDGSPSDPEVKAFLARMVRPGGALPPETP
ncbi:MAG TPA: hypothetical protein VKI44_21440 [Acetobacteraceae bacterium]|nr:hypothetical protein [Acetobacteraceae bacterium]